MSIELVDPKELDEPFLRRVRVKLPSLVEAVQEAMSIEGLVDDDEAVFKLVPDNYSGEVTVYIRKASDES